MKTLNEYMIIRVICTRSYKNMSLEEYWEADPNRVSKVYGDETYVVPIGKSYEMVEVLKTRGYIAGCLGPIIVHKSLEEFSEEWP